MRRTREDWWQTVAVRRDEFLLMACLFVQSLPRFPKKAREAIAMLDEVERTLKRIPKSHYLRREGIQGIAHARAVAASAGLKPDPSYYSGTLA